MGGDEPVAVAALFSHVLSCGAGLVCLIFTGGFLLPPGIRKVWCTKDCMACIPD